MALIEIENMEFHANHGHFKEEQVIGNTFLVDLKLSTILKRLKRVIILKIQSTTKGLTKLLSAR